MNGCLQHGEPVMAGTRRLLVEHLSSAMHLLHAHALTDETIHLIRKELKQARAGLRLLRASLSESAYQQANFTLRDAGQPLTPVRDAKVLHATLIGLQHRTRRRDLRLQQTLRQEQRASRRCLTAKHLKSITACLQTIVHTIQAIPQSRLDDATANTLLTHAYRKARKAAAIALREQDDEHLHEWRKQVKYHVTQLEFVQPIKPKRLAPTIKQMQKLADCLGDDHDLAMLYGRLVQHVKSSAPHTASTALLESLQRRRARLQRKAAKLGSNLYEHKPAWHAKRLAQYLDAWAQDLEHP